MLHYRERVMHGPANNTAALSTIYAPFLPALALRGSASLHGDAAKIFDGLSFSANVLYTKIIVCYHHRFWFRNYSLAAPSN
jgi:hypothetical protein